MNVYPVYAWVKGTRMLWERYEKLTTADVDRIKKFWAGCMSLEEEKQFRKDFPAAFNY
jgi:hypothetical protein